MIVPRGVDHKFPVAMLFLLLLAGAGCADSNPQSKAPATQAAQVVPDCEVTVIDSGWHAFTALAGRIVDGQEVTRPEMGGLGSEPAWARWRATLPVEVDLPRIGNWIESAFWTETGHTGGQKQHTARKTYSESYRWSWDNREFIDQRLEELRAEDACRILPLVETWIPADARPAHLNLYILPTKPEFRFNEGDLFIDTGYFAAIPRERLPGELVGMLFRNLGFIDGPRPRISEGATAIAQSFRLMHNLGLAMWIEDVSNVYFVANHPTFRDVSIVPERFWLGAIRSMRIMNKQTPHLWDNPELMAAEGKGVMTALNHEIAFDKLGYSMAATIATRLGEDRLIDVAGSVPAFVAAFQEAVNGNVEPLPFLSETGGDYPASVPAFAPDVWPGLHALLLEQFPV